MSLNDNTSEERPDFAIFELEYLVEQAQEFDRLYDLGYRSIGDGPDLTVDVRQMPHFQGSNEEHITVVAPEEAPISIGKYKFERSAGGLSVMSSVSLSLNPSLVPDQDYRDSLTVFKSILPIDDKRKLIPVAKWQEIGFKAQPGSRVPFTRPIHDRMRVLLKEGISFFDQIDN